MWTRDELASWWRLPAREVVARLALREVSPAEVLAVALARIEAVAPLVNAVPVLEARAAAHAADPRVASLAPLHGLPLPIKDMTDVAGLPTTLGDPALAHTPAPRSDACVLAIEAAGGIVLGKSNVPFQGLGSDTANPLFGLTRNPWGLAFSTAGSSGGAAAALACGAAWLAQGSDLGGSVRGPASHCGIVGLRPTPGRVGHGGPGTRRAPLDLLNVDGPMARDVRDCALLLDAMAGTAAGDPIAFAPRSGPGPGEAPFTSFSEAAARASLPRRLAVSATLGGEISLHPEVQAVFDAVVARLVAAGVDVEAAEPSFAGVADACYDLRLAATRARTPPEEMRRQREHLPSVARAMHDDALALTLDRVLAAQQRQQRLVSDFAAFWERHPLLLLPTVAVPCHPHANGSANDAPPRGRHWAEDALPVYGITLSHCPAIVIPAGFCRRGLPVGVQLVAPWRGEAALLTAAAAIEDLLRAGGDTVPRAPIEPRSEPRPPPALTPPLPFPRPAPRSPA
jgi:amidase